MTDYLQAKLWLLAVFLALSAFFSGIEAAFISLSRLDVKRMVDEKLRFALLVRELKEDYHKLVITILIGNNLVNIAASTIAASIAIEVFSSNAIGISTGVMTFVILIFGEITPKTLAIGHKKLICRYSALPLKVLSVLLFPAIRVLDLFSKFLSRVFRAANEERITEDEIKTLVSLSEEEGSIEKDEKVMINNILRFNDIEVAEIMTPRTDVYFIESSQKLSEQLPSIIESGHSRIPVFRKDRIVGILFIRDVLEAVVKGRTNIPISKLLRPPIIVPEQKKIDELFKEMQKRKTHIAIIVDEYGSMSGIVTIEDILEEIVGEIYDETDKRTVMVKKVDERTFLVNGSKRIVKLNEQLGLNLRFSEDYDTISGFLLKKLGRIPKKGEKLQLKKYTFVVTKADRYRIRQVKIIRN